MKSSEKILSYLKAHDRVTAASLVDYLGVTDRAVRKQLKKLMDQHKIQKIGTPPRVYYFLPPPPDSQAAAEVFPRKLDATFVTVINENFFYVSARGREYEGWEAFAYWCKERDLDVIKMARQYHRTMQAYQKLKKNGLIDGMPKLRKTFPETFLDRMYYLDFYSIEIFGKTKLGQQLLYAKQSQNRQLINKIADTIKPQIVSMITQQAIDGVGYIPPTVKRELQLIRQLQNRLNLDTRTITIHKIKTPIIVPQKTLTNVKDRVINAQETMSVDDTGMYNNILLIDDALGSGATLNEVARKIRAKGMCKGLIIGLAITGSAKGFDVISEI